MIRSADRTLPVDLSLPSLRQPQPSHFIPPLQCLGDQFLSGSTCHFRTIVSQPFAQNSYLAWLDHRGDCLVVDPGFEPDAIIEELDRRQLHPAAILNTHAHFDHVAGNQALKDKWPDCPLIIGDREAFKLQEPRENLSGLFGLPLTSPPADQTVSDGEQISYAGFDLLVREIPGHSSGHVVFIWREGDPPVVFGGDVLFAGSVGRTDFPGGDHRLLIRGIHEKLYSLPDATLVLPGHGETTTIGAERRDNPFTA